MPKAILFKSQEHAGLPMIIFLSVTFFMLMFACGGSLRGKQKDSRLLMLISLERVREYFPKPRCSAKPQSVSAQSKTEPVWTAGCALGAGHIVHISCIKNPGISTHFQTQRILLCINISIYSKKKNEQDFHNYSSYYVISSVIHYHGKHL